MNSQTQYTIALSVPRAPACVRTFTIDDTTTQGFISGGDAVSEYFPCPIGTGPGGIVPGDYPPQDLSQEQRQYLYEAFGNSGEAPPVFPSIEGNTSDPNQSGDYALATNPNISVWSNNNGSGGSYAYLI